MDWNARKTEKLREGTAFGIPPLGVWTTVAFGGKKRRRTYDVNTERLEQVFEALRKRGRRALYLHMSLVMACLDAASVASLACTSWSCYLVAMDCVCEGQSFLAQHQVDSVRALVHAWSTDPTAGRILSDKPGLGKTATALASFQARWIHVFQRDPDHKLLLISDCGVLDQIRREIETRFPELWKAKVVTYHGPKRVAEWTVRMNTHTPFQVVLTSYETVRAELNRLCKTTRGGAGPYRTPSLERFTQLMNASPLFSGPVKSPIFGRTWGMVILDEADRLRRGLQTKVRVKLSLGMSTDLLPAPSAGATTPMVPTPQYAPSRSGLVYFAKKEDAMAAAEARRKQSTRRKLELGFMRGDGAKESGGVVAASGLDDGMGPVYVCEARYTEVPQTATAAALLLIPRLCTLPITATPLNNGPMDLVMLMVLINPARWGKREVWDRIAAYVQRGLSATSVSVPAPRDWLELQRMVLCHTSHPGFGLPPKQVHVHQLPMSQMQRLLTAMIRRESNVVMLPADTALNTLWSQWVLARQTRLSEVCSTPEIFAKSPLLLDPWKEMAIPPHRWCVEDSPKIAWLVQFVAKVMTRSGPRQQVLVFSNYKATLALSFRYLVQLGVFDATATPLLLTGDQPAEERRLTVNRLAEYQDRPRTKPAHERVCFITLECGGKAIDGLKAACVTVLMDSAQFPALEDQAESRAQRHGQTQPVESHRLICDGVYSMEQFKQRNKSQKDQKNQATLPMLFDASSREERKHWFDCHPAFEGAQPVEIGRFCHSSSEPDFVLNRDEVKTEDRVEALIRSYLPSSSLPPVPSHDSVDDVEDDRPSRPSSPTSSIGVVSELAWSALGLSSSSPTSSMSPWTNSDT